MRVINNIVLHCTATPQTTTVKSIMKYWRSLGWINPGYHHIILPSGQVIDLLPIDQVSNGVAGHNHDSIHISYIGGVDPKGESIDNRTEAQKKAQIKLLRKYYSKFPNAIICGHRDFPGVKKECPSFDVAKWLTEIDFYNIDEETRF